jgi:hypothetical protein
MGQLYQDPANPQGYGSRRFGATQPSTEIEPARPIGRVECVSATPC